MGPEPEVLTLVERSPDALLAVSATGRVLYATAALEREFGLTPSSVSNRSFSDLVHPADRERVNQVVRDVAAAAAEQPPATTVVRLGTEDRWRAAVARLGRADLPGGRVAVVSLAPASSPGGADDDAAIEVDTETESVALPAALAADLGLPSGVRPPLHDLFHPDDVPVVRALVRGGAVPEPGFGVRMMGRGGRWRHVPVAGGPAPGRYTIRSGQAPAPDGTVDALPVGVLVLDHGLAAVHRNARAATLLGSDPGTGWLRAVDEQDRDRLARVLREAAANRQQATTRVLLTGGQRVLELRSAPLPVPGRGDLLACVAEDVTSTVRVEDEAARLASVVEASSDFIATTQPDGRIRWANPAFRLFLGAVTDEPVGFDLADLYAPWARERWEEEALPRLATRGLWNGEMALQPIGKVEVPVSQVSVAHLDARGDVSFMSHVIRDLTARKVHEASLAHRATHDPLTDLPNRILLMDRLHTALARARRGGGVVALLFCDLDDFKAVNDRHGHDAGDRLLLTVAERLVGVLREPDTVARLGGDEFVMLCEGLRSAEEADLIASRVTAALAEIVDLGDLVLQPSVSVGVAVTVDGDAEAESLLREADRAMYRTKRRKQR